MSSMAGNSSVPPVATGAVGSLLPVGCPTTLHPSHNTSVINAGTSAPTQCSAALVTTVPLAPSSFAPTIPAPSTNTNTMHAALPSAAAVSALTTHSNIIAYPSLTCHPTLSNPPTLAYQAFVPHPTFVGHPNLNPYQGIHASPQPPTAAALSSQQPRLTALPSPSLSILPHHATLMQFTPTQALGEAAHTHQQPLQHQHQVLAPQHPLQQPPQEMMPSQISVGVASERVKAKATEVPATNGIPTASSGSNKENHSSLSPCNSCSDCFVCNNKTHLSNRNAEKKLCCIKLTAVMPHSHAPLLVLLADVIGYNLAAETALHSKVVCSDCYTLLEVIDEIQLTQTKNKADIRRKFQITLSSHGLNYARSEKTSRSLCRRCGGHLTSQRSKKPSGAGGGNAPSGNGGTVTAAPSQPQSCKARKRQMKWNAWKKSAPQRSESADDSQDEEEEDEEETDEEEAVISKKSKKQDASYVENDSTVVEFEAEDVKIDIFPSETSMMTDTTNSSNTNNFIQSQNQSSQENILSSTSSKYSSDTANALSSKGSSQNSSSSSSKSKSGNEASQSSSSNDVEESSNPVVRIYDSDPAIFAPDERLKVGVMRRKSVSENSKYQCHFCSHTCESAMSLKMHVRVTHLPVMVYDSGRGIGNSSASTVPPPPLQLQKKSSLYGSNNNSSQTKVSGRNGLNKGSLGDEQNRNDDENDINETEDEDLQEQMKWRMGVRLQNVQTDPIMSGNEKPFACLFCESMYKLQSSLQSHFRDQHSPRKPYSCSACGESYRRNIELTRHKSNSKHCSNKKTIASSSQHKNSKK